MAELYSILKPESRYYDKHNYQSLEDYNRALRISTTVYVGNLSFFTTQDSIWELFSHAGQVKDVIMGINDDGNPCGFCFVIFNTHEEALYAVEYISKTKLHERVIRVDWDAGYKKNREKGRGSGGQQRRDDFRKTDDSERPTRKRVNTNYEKREPRTENNRYNKHSSENQSKQMPHESKQQPEQY